MQKCERWSNHHSWLLQGGREPSSSLVIGNEKLTGEIGGMGPVSQASMF